MEIYVGDFCVLVFRLIWKKKRVYRRTTVLFLDFSNEFGFGIVGLYMTL